MSINTTIIIKISLNKKDRIIDIKIVSYCERCLLNKRFKTIQEARRKKEKKKNRLLALKNYILVYIVVFDNDILFEQDSRQIIVCNINS